MYLDNDYENLWSNINDFSENYEIYDFNSVNKYNKLFLSAFGYEKEGLGFM